MVKSAEYMRKYRAKKAGRLVVPQSVVDGLRAGADLGGLNLPGDAFAEQQVQALAVVRREYQPPAELVAYISGSYPNGVAHYEVDVSDSSARVRVGGVTTFVQFRGFHDQRDRQTLIDIATSSAYHSAKRRGLL